VGLVILVGLIYLIPTVSPSLPLGWTKILPEEKIRLGLDLQGGMHLVLEVETEKAVESRAENLAQDIKDALRSKRIPFRRVERTSGWQIEIDLANPEQQTELKKIIEEEFGSLEWTGATTTDGKSQIRLKIKDRDAENIQKLAADQALETIRNRVDQFGVSEPDIRPQGEDRLLIQLPGIQDPQRAKDLIGKTAILEFKLVDEEVSVQDAKEGKTPAGSKLYPFRQFISETGQTTHSQIVLKNRTLMTGEYITNAQVSIDTQYNTPYVALEFDSRGGDIFERITEQNVKKRLAIVLDGTVYSAPVIQEKIGGGRASITGSFTMEEARDLAIVLRAGALPAPVTILEERTVGPSLGKDSIRKGLFSMLVGGLGVILFMIIYYQLSGVVANLALFLNILLILGGLAAFQATLTLPGIAGIILTIGMAVDANVLIFERIREELRLGKTPRAALETGYSRATLTILDANITTLIAAVVLFQFGTGPVRGFAVTLTIGIIASMFTAIIVTRVVFDYFLIQRRVKKLSI
jgi:preprotein translocase subunit SecD